MKNPHKLPNYEIFFHVLINFVKITKVIKFYEKFLKTLKNEKFPNSANNMPKMKISKGVKKIKIFSETVNFTKLSERVIKIKSIFQ